jgi:hypothetical protein
MTHLGNKRPLAGSRLSGHPKSDYVDRTIIASERPASAAPKCLFGFLRRSVMEMSLCEQVDDAIDDFKHLLPRFIAVSLSSLKRSDLRPQPLAKTENVAAQMWPAAEILYHATDILRSASGALPWKAAWSCSTFGCRTRLADTAATEWALWKTLPVSIARIFQAVRTEKAGVADCGGAGLREAIRCYQKQTKYANNDSLGLALN